MGEENGSSNSTAISAADRQARDLFHSSGGPRFVPEWRSLFTAPPRTYADLSGSNEALCSEDSAPQPQKIVPPYSKAELAGAKLVRGLQHVEHVTIHIESNSVYGAAMLMPQLARSTGWNCYLTSLSISSYLYLMLCITVHGMMLMFMNKEEHVMDGFAGQMYLCDFGENIERAERGLCEGTDCIGPAGTQLSGPRLYSWSQWTLRSFVYQSFQQVFPDLDIAIDPGEYGLESYNCRLVCVILFVISIIPEMELCIDMVRLLWYVPSRAESWIELKEDAEPGLETAEQCCEKVVIKVAGMPYCWKVWNYATVLFPKVFLVLLTARTGICFLMETAGIDDIIVNSVALGFLLSLDELVTDNLMSPGANALIDLCEELRLDDSAHGCNDEEELDESATIDGWKLFSGRNLLCESFRELFQVQFARLIVAAVVTGVFIGEYYMYHCDWKDGRYISKPMHAPKTMSYGYLNAFFPWFFEVPHYDEVSWQMPTVQRPINGR